jgi:L,D-transpeptidase YcbB
VSHPLLSRRLFVKAACLVPFTIMAPAFAKDVKTTGSIASVPPKPSKLATKTEIVSGRGEAPMLTLGSINALENAISSYEEIVSGGGWPQLSPGKYNGKSSPASITMLRQRLVRENYVDFDTLSSADAGKFDDTLIQAIKAFQFNHGLLPSGKIDERTRTELNVSAQLRLSTLKENYPRITEYLKDLGPRYVAVNIPAAQLETIELGQVYSRHNVVVGKTERPTPALKSRVSDIIFNPVWNAPASIVEKDIIPKFLADPTYLDQMRIHVYDGPGGQEVDPTSVDWANTPADRFQFQQEPGEHNALATVKVNFPNKYMVYMHDTPHRETFASNNRFESSGCCRVDQVHTLINWIMNGQDGYEDGQFELMTANAETHETKIIHPPDVRFMYLTAWATEDGRINFRNDIYGLDGKDFVLGQPDPVIKL